MNVRIASYSSVQRRIPQQERGERRVAGLLEAAETVIAEIGYEAATMSAIAERAGAAIGSLYQFFPSKACITQALRTEYAKQFDSMYAPLAVQAKTLDRGALVSQLVDVTVRFVDTHPAMPALLDAPQSTRTPVAIVNVIRERFAGFLLAQSPRMSRQKALRLGTVALHIIKALNQFYVEAPPRERRRIVQEFKMVLLSYLNARINPSAGGTVRR
jgi:AcrR family transcriptional regulator